MHHGVSESRQLTVALSGASGLVGSVVGAMLTGEAHRVVRLVRPGPRAQEAAESVIWDPAVGLAEPSRLEGVDAIVHLAGENIAAGRWTASRKRAIRDSRVEGTRKLVRSLDGLKEGPATFVCASAIGWYGPRDGAEKLAETASPGEGFLAEVCHEWETAADEAAGQGLRVVKLRFGAVLSDKGGFLAKVLVPFRLGLGGPVGSGKQVLSWVAVDDAAAVIVESLEREELRGPINVTAPHAVTNAEFTTTLARALRRPAVLPAPGFALRAIFGDLADELLLAGQRVVPRVLLEHGFSFRFPELGPALRHYLGRTG
jgi:uncharacterized protein (TIGR01777 family)